MYYRYRVHNRFSLVVDAALVASTLTCVCATAFVSACVCNGDTSAKVRLLQEEHQSALRLVNDEHASALRLLNDEHASAIRLLNVEHENKLKVCRSVPDGVCPLKRTADGVSLACPPGVVRGECSKSVHCSYYSTRQSWSTH